MKTAPAPPLLLRIPEALQPNYAYAYWDMLAAAALSQSSGLAFGFQEAEDVVLADGTLDVTDDALFVEF